MGIESPRPLYFLYYKRICLRDFIESFTALAVIDLEIDMTYVQKDIVRQIRASKSVVSASILLKVYVFNNHGYIPNYVKFFESLLKNESVVIYPAKKEVLVLSIFGEHLIMKISQQSSIQ